MKKYILSICGVLLLVILGISCVFSPSKAVFAETEKMTAKSYLLMDYSTGEVLNEQNADEKLPVASMVKLMTILLTFEEIENGHLSLDEKISTTENASGMGGSQVFIDPYVSYKCEDLLKSAIMASANDACVALAEKISGSESEFVKKMNKRAKELGMTNTLYANCTGLPALEQYSSARDISKVNRELLNHNDYHKYSTVWMDKLVHPSGRETELVNTNKLIRYYKGCDSGKTGHTNEAGYCLSASAERDGLRLISTVIGSPNSKERFAEVSNLFNYGFANYYTKEIVNTTDVLGVLTINRSAVKEMPIFASEVYKGLYKKGEKDTFETQVELIQKPKAPIKAGDVVGQIKIIKNGEIIKEIDLLASLDAPKYNLKDCFEVIFENWDL